MVKLIPYLLVSNAKKAISYYKTVFGAKLLEHQPFAPEMGESMNFPTDFDYKNSTMHAKLEIAGVNLYLADNNQKTNDYGHVEITLELDSKSQISKYSKNLKKEGCEVKMGLTQYEWGWYGRFVDKFGVGWQLNFIPSEKGT